MNRVYFSVHREQVWSAAKRHQALTRVVYDLQHYDRPGVAHFIERIWIMNIDNTIDLDEGITYVLTNPSQPGWY